MKFKSNGLLVISAMFFVIALCSVNVYAQNETSEIEKNVNAVMGTVSAVVAIITTIAGVIPTIIWFKRNVVGIKNEQDYWIIEGSKKIRESDFWTLENQKRLRVALSASQGISGDLLKIISDNREKLGVTEEQINKLNTNLSEIISVIPKPEEEIKIQKELETIAKDDDQFG